MNTAAFVNGQAYYSTLSSYLDNARSDKELFEAVVNSPFRDKLKAASLGLGVSVLLLVDKTTKTIDRIALSDTEQAKGAVKVSVKPFREIRIPLSDKNNLIVKCINERKYQQTDDWRYLFTPELTAQEARFNQAGAGIGCSVVYPLEARGGGALIFSYFLTPEKIGSDHHEFMSNYSKLVSDKLALK